VFGIQVTDFTDTANSATTQGTLRYALTNGPDEDVIRFTAVTAGTTTIALGSALPQVTRSITIEGNGVTLTPGAGWTSNASSQLLRIYNSDAAITVNISRVHFEDGRATTGAGAAVYNNGETVNLESCIFSGNRVTSGNGGAIYNAGTMSIKGCTFYDNTTPGSGGAIFNTGSSTTLTLTGNLFYGNTAPYGPVVYNYSSGTVTSNGYNVVDVDLGTENTQSGWTAGITGDIKFTGAPFSTTNPITFAPVTGLNSVLPSTALEGFPTVDFKGETRTWPGAPGAVK
jgi:predicted outer membrane repeat protein